MCLCPCVGWAEGYYYSVGTIVVVPVPVPVFGVVVLTVYLVLFLSDGIGCCYLCWNLWNNCLNFARMVLTNFFWPLLWSLNVSVILLFFSFILFVPFRYNLEE